MEARDLSVPIKRGGNAVANPDGQLLYGGDRPFPPNAWACVACRKVPLIESYVKQAYLVAMAELLLSNL